MGSRWTTECKARQPALIHTWKPWERATGPRTTEGKARTAMNAFKGGHWLMLRELTREVNAEIKAARDLVSEVTG